jgi:hypothetical protein
MAERERLPNRRGAELVDFEHAGRIHQTLKITLVMAARVSSTLWKCPIW